MTREEAISELKTRYLTMSQCLDKEELHKANEAIDLAIEALQTEPLEVEAAKLQSAYNEGLNAYKRIMAREKQFNSYCQKCRRKLEPCEDELLDKISKAELECMKLSVSYLKPPFANKNVSDLYKKQAEGLEIAIGIIKNYCGMRGDADADCDRNS